MQSSVRLLVGAGILLALGAVAYKIKGDMAASMTPYSGENGGPSAVDTGRVVALGTLEPNTGVIDIGATAGDMLGDLKVKAGQHVKRGETMALLESYALRSAEKQAADLALREGQQRRAIEQAYGDKLVAEAELGVDQMKLQQLDIDSLEAKLVLVKANLTLAQRDLQRMQKLDASIVSPQEREHQSALVDQAQAELVSTDSMLAKSRAGYDFAKREAAEKLEAAKINRDRLLAVIDLDALKNQVTMADAKLQLSMVVAPVDGEVLEIIMHPGETVGQKPVMRMGDTSQMYAVAEVYETQVGSLKLGQEAKVTSEALRQPLKGSVDEIGTMVAKNDVMSLKPTSTTDLRVVKVRVRLDDSAAASKLVNLQVTVKIHTDGSKWDDDSDQAGAAKKSR